MPTRTKIYFDGSLRPAGMATAAVLRGRVTIVPDRGAGTSMTAEWLALLDAVALAIRERVADAVILGDAAAVVAQANDRVRVPPAHRDHRARLAELLADAPAFRIRHIARTQNLAGIALDRWMTNKLHL